VNRRRIARTATAPLVLAIGAALLTGCSSSTKGTATSVATSVASAAQSAAQSVASQLASQGTSALQSATGALGSVAASAASAASSAFASATAGLDAVSDVSLGKVSSTSDGKVQVPVTVTNHQSTAQSYKVQVSFKDASGNLLDAVVLSIPSVQPNQPANATAVSNRTLSGTVQASVERAVRF
jgi:hypothetical protein